MNENKELKKEISKAVNNAVKTIIYEQEIINQIWNDISEMCQMPKEYKISIKDTVQQVMSEMSSKFPQTVMGEVFKLLRKKLQYYVGPVPNYWIRSYEIEEK